MKFGDYRLTGVLSSGSLPLCSSQYFMDTVHIWHSSWPCFEHVRYKYQGLYIHLKVPNSLLQPGRPRLPALWAVSSWLKTEIWDGCWELCTKTVGLGKHIVFMVWILFHMHIRIWNALTSVGVKLHRRLGVGEKLHPTRTMVCNFSSVYPINSVCKWIISRYYI